MTPTTSTTACAPNCSASTTLPPSRCRRRSSPTSARPFPSSMTRAPVHEFIRRLIGLLIEDVIAETARRLAALAPRSADDVRQRAGGGRRILAGRWRAPKRAIKDFLKPRMYRHARVKRMHGRGRGAWSATCSRATARHPDDLPAEWRRRARRARRGRRARATSPISSPA